MNKENVAIAVFAAGLLLTSGAFYWLFGAAPTALVIGLILVVSSVWL